MAVPTQPAEGACLRFPPQPPTIPRRPNPHNLVLLTYTYTYHIPTYTPPTISPFHTHTHIHTHLSGSPAIHPSQSSLHAFTYTYPYVRFPGYNAYVTELLGRLEASNLAPNADTYRALLRVCAQAGNPFLAERYLEQMQAERGLEPGREHYHALLHAYAMYVPGVGGHGRG